MRTVSDEKRDTISDITTLGVPWALTRLEAWRVCIWESDNRSGGTGSRQQLVDIHTCVCVCRPDLVLAVLTVVFLVWGTKISDYSYCSFNLQYFQVLAGAIEEETCGHVSLVRYPQINSWIHDLIARQWKALSGWMDWTGSYLES